MALSSGERAPTAALTTYPTAMPTTPASTPMSAVSVSTWPTTRRLVHPSARSVPISRTRFCTLESVSSTAMAKVLSSTMTVSAPPSRVASCCASCRLPVTVSATSLLVTTCAPGSAFLMAAATSAVFEESVTLTSTSFTRPVRVAMDCSVLSGKYTSAVLPVRVGSARPTTVYAVPLTVRVLPTASFCCPAYVVLTTTS